MTYPILIFVAFAGSAVLGFLFAWTFQNLKLKNSREENEELAAEVKDQVMAFNRLRAESDAQQLAVENLQHLLQEVENQSFEAEQELKQLRADYQLLQEAHQKSTENPKADLPEIEVIREVPVLVFRDPSFKNDKREKAKKLVKAFKKGYTQEIQKTVPPQP